MTCERCGQKQFLLVPGRTVCERCRMGRTIIPDTASEAVTVVQRPVEACAGCGRTEVDGRPGLRLTLADRYCLGCRVQGVHR